MLGEDHVTFVMMILEPTLPISHNVFLKMTDATSITLLMVESSKIERYIVVSYFEPFLWIDMALAVFHLFEENLQFKHNWNSMESTTPHM